MKTYSVARRALVASFAFTLLSATANAQLPGDTGGEYWVDGPVEVQVGSDRAFPDVAINSAGDSIFVWSAFIPGGSLRFDIYLRRFDASRNPLGDPVKVNTIDDDDQSNAPACRQR